MKKRGPRRRSIKIRKFKSIWKQKLLQDTFHAYGKNRCTRCQKQDDTLQLEEIRHTFHEQFPWRNWVTLYSKLRQAGYPFAECFRLLCPTCHDYELPKCKCGNVREPGVHRCKACKIRGQRHKKKVKKEVFAKLGAECHVCGNTKRNELRVERPAGWNRDNLGKQTDVFALHKTTDLPPFTLICKKCKKDLSKRVCHRCRTPKENPSDQACQRCIGENRALKKRQRLEVLMAYSRGKLACNCCGENYMPFLQLDHVNSDGHLDRKRGLVGTSLYKYLRDRAYPDKERFQLLCGNCNFAKAWTGGGIACPCVERRSS